jgi:hypothetical protein
MVGALLTGFGFGNSGVFAAPPLKEDSLAGITQNWDKNLPSASRFTVLSAFGGAAVRDNNTGLVWVQSPNTNVVSWQGATASCINQSFGSTVGWRLPSVAELRSVQDPSLPAPFVPAGIFTGIQVGQYWSATTSASNPTNAWVIGFDGTDPGHFDKNNNALYWCVRGPMNADAY